MKFTKVGAAIFFTICGVNAAMASNTITFNGTVLDKGCDITVDGGTATATVDLGSTAATDLVKMGDLGAPKQFVFDLANCPTASSANIVFSGQVDADANNPSYFKNTAEVGAATMVAVQLKQGGSNGTIVENNADNDEIDLSSGAATETYTAQMIATGQAVAGSVKSVLTYNVRYN
ncbi:fimbrial protein [Enterobacteriaceae bacterium H11S18]|uniref:fimbrial protein n=1 Tax=Enterobacteriaceae TaxID=543 RepID=UPI0019285B21|nr:MULTISPECIES: fimbrial protein [Enterobacteriaceae]MCT4706577.1 fimbrial protein [Dryocola clanedunensis]MCT4713389.1 fimbrial protein [Dryocola clanedunensis]